MGVRARAADWRALPPRVAWFRTRAERVARRIGDDFSRVSVTRADELGHLIKLARGKRFVVELGTGTAWTTVSLALADSNRTVVSYDPMVRDARERYLELAGSARDRITLVQQPGESGPRQGDPAAELLFIDSSHDREQTLAEVAAWREALAPGAIIAFHDYDEPAYPGVTEAVRELGLDGEVFGHLFIWRS
jgi:predicted O-methyltransferase YrrM